MTEPSAAPAPDGGPDDPMNPPRLRVGDPAPPFDLEGIDGATGEVGRFRLSDYAGAPLIVAFYPADNTPVCTQQLLSYTRDIGLLAESGAQLVAISPQDPQSHQGFADAQGGFAFPLLSDPDKSVGRAYGIVGLLDLYRRSTFVIDGAGIVVSAHRSIGPGMSFRALDTLVGEVPSSDAVRDAEQA
ncbi:MAG: peroxiredoxin [Acidimicrobiales bacterium]